MNNRQGVLTIVSGFSGAGKGSVITELMSRYDHYALSVSATTRKPRPGEKEGVHYFFRTTEQFEEMIREGAFLEYARYVDNYYGTPRDYVISQMESGKDVLLEIDLQGAQQVKKLYPDALTVFVSAPSAEVLEKRLRSRETEEEDVIRGRLRRAVTESEYMDSYDYILVNDDLGESAEMLNSLIEAAHMRSCSMEDFVAQIKAGVRTFEKGE